MWASLYSISQHGSKQEGGQEGASKAKTIVFLFPNHSSDIPLFSVFFFFFNFFFFPNFYLFYYYLFLIYGYVGSSFLCEGFHQPRQAGATLHCCARASHHRGLSCCGAQAPDTQAQQLWLTGPAAPRHVGSSQTRARTRVPCISRQTLNHCATREALFSVFFSVGVSHQV